MTGKALAVHHPQVLNVVEAPGKWYCWQQLWYWKLVTQQSASFPSMSEPFKPRHGCQLRKQAPGSISASILMLMTATGAVIKPAPLCVWNACGHIVQSRYAGMADLLLDSPAFLHGDEKSSRFGRQSCMYSSLVYRDTSC